MTSEYDEVIAELRRLGAPRLKMIENDDKLRAAIRRARGLDTPVPYKKITELTGYEREAASLIVNPARTRKAKRTRAGTDPA